MNLKKWLMISVLLPLSLSACVHSNRIYRIAAPRGNAIASVQHGGTEDTVRIFGDKSDLKLNFPLLELRPALVQSLQWSPSGKWLAIQAIDHRGLREITIVDITLFRSRSMTGGSVSSLGPPGEIFEVYGGKWNKNDTITFTHEGVDTRVPKHKLVTTFDPATGLYQVQD